MNTGNHKMEAVVTFQGVSVSGIGALSVEHRPGAPPRPERATVVLPATLPGCPGVSPDRSPPDFSTDGRPR